jgi:uncharacterized protein YkwD
MQGERGVMRTVGSRWLMTVLLVAASLAPGVAQPGPLASRPSIDGADVARRIHAYVNEERVRRGLAALAWDARLARIALRHSRDMAKRDYLSHDNPEGQDFDARYRQGGYTCAIRVGNLVHAGAENIALGRLYNSMRVVNGVADYDWNSAEQIARKVVDGWMDSRGHRRNILTPHWRREGIGVEIHPDNMVYVTQNFC